MKHQHSKWMTLLAGLLMWLSLYTQARQNDDLQEYLNQLPQQLEQSRLGADAHGLRQARSLSVDIPVDLPVIDLSQYPSSQNRTSPLSVSSSVRFTNGSITSASAFAGGGCLLEVSGGAVVVLDATATLSAMAVSDEEACKAAVGIYGGSTFCQYGYVYAPGSGVAVYIDDAASTYRYMPGKTIGSIDNAGNGTVEAMTAETVLPAVSDCDWTIGPGGDFPDINTAMDDDRVQDGHSLEVLPGTTVSGEQVILKSVTIIGPGYAKVNGTRPCHFADISIEAEGTVLRALAVGTVSVRDDNVNIERCYVSQSITADVQYFPGNASVKGCFINAVVNGVDSEEWIFQNNIICTHIAEIADAVFDHNILYLEGREGSFGASGCTITNNIIFWQDNEGGQFAEDDENECNNNVISHSGLSETYPDNRFDYTALSQVFAATGSMYDEAFWQLTETSPAIGYATDGGDCGPWSGEYPYWINGVEEREPVVPLSGDYVLDLNADDDPSANIYQSLLSLFTDISAKGVNGNLHVEVANGVYQFDVDDKSLRVLSRMCAILKASSATITMQASAAAMDESALETYSGFTATSGTTTISGQGYDKLVNTNMTDKWCTHAPAYVEFNSSTPIFPVEYILTTGNDNSAHTGRCPKKWTLKGKLNLGDEWQTIASVENDNTLQDVNLTSYTYKVDKPTQCKYFRFDVLVNESSDVFQFTELRLRGNADGSGTGIAVFNFNMDATYMMQHAADLAEINQMMEEMLSYMSLKKIKVYINGNAVIFDDFEMAPNDLLALKNMYNQWGGKNWTNKRWSFASNGRKRSDFPGVGFNEDGRVITIDLEDNGLKGELFLVSSPQLEMLTTLNLSRNQLTGDVGKLVGEMSRLTTLNMQYNQLWGLSETLPKTCKNVSLEYQNRIYNNINYLTENFYDLPPVVVPVCLKATLPLTLPTLYTYYSPTRRGLYGASGPSPMIGMLNDDSSRLLSLTFNDLHVYKYEQDKLLAMILEEGFARHSAYPVILRYAEGDADFSGYTNVYDVQWTLNYILTPAKVTDFNYSAANTYTDNIINVQDIVATVNVILSQSTEEAAAARDLADHASEPCNADASEPYIAGTVYTQQGYVMLSAEKEVSAIDIILDGISTTEVALMLNQRDYQMIGRDTDSGSRYVIFSPSGKSLPTDRAVTVLRMLRPGLPAAIQCSDPDAQEVRIAIDGQTTGITENENAISNDGTFFDLQGRRTDGFRKGIYIRNGRKVMR